VVVEGGKPTSSEKLLKRLKTHIETVVGRYVNDISMWDVVNEALDDSNDQYLCDSIWTRTTGEGFIVRAFHWTREMDPDSILI
jgi:endo-1,4-beta-xylanase